MAARSGVPSRSSSFFTVLSRSLRRDARPIPKPKPRSKPSARLIAFLGDAGDEAGIASLTVETFTGESTPIP
jgi:hypothetical protein